MRVRDGSLRGITLSDAEKSRVKAIHAKYSAESKALRESLRPALQEVRAARQKRDSAAVKAALAKTTGEREKLWALMERQTRRDPLGAHAGEPEGVRREREDAGAAARRVDEEGRGRTR